MKKSLLLLMGSAILNFGCTGAPAPVTSPTAAATPIAAVSTPVEVSTPSAVSPEVQAKAEELLAGRKDGRLDYKQLSVKENGPAFVHLAQTSDDSLVLVGALKGIGNTYHSDKEYPKSNKADASVDEAILRNLRSKDKAVLHQAILSSKRTLGKEPNPEVVGILIEFVESHPEVGARYESLDALNAVDNLDKDPKILDAFLKAMKDDAPIASLALFRRKFGFKRGERAEEMKATTTTLLSHKDPGVRGRAIDAFADFHPDDEAKILEKAEPMLKDANPFVRASAVGALSKVQDPKAVHLIMTLVDDTEKNTYDIKFKNLLGQTETVHHDGSAWSRVNDAALYALRSQTSRKPEGEKFVYDKIDHKQVDQDIAAQAQKAKDWYVEFKKKNPPK
jgi:HEAT repeat protein